MNWADYLSQGLNLLGTFNLKVAAFMFLVCFMGEAANIFVPYLLETTWLLVGYQLSAGVLKFPDLLLLLLMAQLGRQVGAIVLYSISRSGGTLMLKFPLLAKVQNRFKLKTDASSITLPRIFRRVNPFSPFSVALGRLMWMRIPLTLLLAAKRKLKVLLLGTALSSVVHDGTFTVMGAVLGITIKPDPVHVFLYSLAALTTSYAITFGVRQLVRLISRRRADNHSQI